MKINSVSYCNIDKVYKASIAGKTNQNFKKSVGANFYQLLNHASITFDISEVSVLEAFMMKQFCNGNTIQMETISDIDFINKDKFPASHKSASTLLTTLDAIDADDDIETKPGMCLLPTECIRKQMLVTLKGNSLGIILSSMPDSFFINAFKLKSVDEIPSVMPEINEGFENQVISTFMESFYKFMADRLTRVDLITDATINEEYYKYMDNTLSVTLSHVNTPYGIMNFLGDDADNLPSQIPSCKKTFQNVSRLNHDELFKSTHLFYEVSCTFYTFLEMYLALPFNFFVDYQDLKILTKSKLIIPDGLSKYNVRINNRVSELIDELNMICTKEEYKLEKYNHILLNTKITFTMDVSFFDITNTLCYFEKDIVEGSIYGNTNSYLVLELLKIIESIKDNSKTIFSVLNS